MDSVEKPKIALFGGSFDPVHLGHLEIARAAHESCALNRVIFLPCWQSPHKTRQMAKEVHRAAMLKLATRDLSWAEISEWELGRGSPSYSWMAAQHFAAENPDAELYWILGTDQWEALERWSKPELLAQLLTFIVFPRGAAVTPQADFRHVAIEARHPASSTQARGLVASGGDTSGTLHPEVADYIAEHGLYRDA